ncbi:hypothetical protein HD554DRAFT_2169737 [Boletus coccyginus]|nr:hypothetical protein HD554DRAFT_2169737 [Boletus coccyginus]
MPAYVTAGTRARLCQSPSLGNFSLNSSKSINKNRAAEAVQPFLELNVSIKEHANTRTLDTVLLVSFSAVIAHYLNNVLLKLLSSFLWNNPFHLPLVVMHSTCFLAKFFIQFHEHTGKHLAWSALFTALKGNGMESPPTVEHLRQQVQSIIGDGVDLSKALNQAIGKLVWEPSTELSNTAAFLGGMVVQ